MKTSAQTPGRRRRRRGQRPRRVLIVNGSTLWREALTEVINHAPDLKVCGKAMGEQAAFEQVHRLKPHVVVTEIFRPQDLGFVRELHRRHPRLPVLAFSFRDEEAYAPRALEAGARGYLMKNVEAPVLLEGIRKVLNGWVVLSPAMAVRMNQGAVGAGNG